MKKFIMMAAVVGTMAFGLVGCGAGDSVVGGSEETTVAEDGAVEEETAAEDESVAEVETTADDETVAEGETSAN